MKISTMMMAMLALVLCAGIVSAADAPAKAKIKKVAGEITAIDTTGNTVSVQPKTPKDGKAPDVVVAPVTATTTVTINGEKKTLADLKVGQKALITYDADGKNAVSIVVAPPMEHNRK